MKQIWALKSKIEAPVWIIIVFIVSFISFHTAYPLLYLIIFFILGLSLRLSQREIMITVGLVALWATIVTIKGFGPFAMEFLLASFALLSSFILTMLLTTFVVRRTVFEHQQIATQLHQQNQQTRQFLEAMPVGVIIVDTKGLLYYANRRGQELFQGVNQETSFEQVVNYPVYMVGTDQPYPTEKRPIIQALQGQSSTVDDIEIRRVDKSIPIEVWGTPIFDKQGQVVYAMVAFQDITERKQSEKNQVHYTEQLKTLNQQLENYSRTLEQKVTERTNALKIQTEEAIRANQAKSRFLATASHDLRQPLHALNLFVDALNYKVTDLGTRAIIYKMQQSLEAMTIQFNALLDISRLDAGAVLPDIQSFCLCNLLKHLYNEFVPQLKEKKLEFKLDDKEIFVQTDPFLLERILRNLLTNALKFTEQGYIELHHQQQGQEVHITVTDTGIGIPKEQEQNIFIEFYQLHNPERDRTKGLGLGLSIVRRLAQLLNHPLSVHSTLGEGSTFKITIPVSQVEVTKGQSKCIMAALQEEKMTLKGRILVIDDEAIIRKITGEQLKRWGYDTIIADTIESSIQQIERLKFIPQIIIADYRLREEKTGLQAIQAVQSFLEQSIPSILISGDTSTELAKKAQEKGYKLLHKPVKPAHLRKLIHYYLRLSTS